MNYENNTIIIICKGMKPRRKKERGELERGFLYLNIEANIEQIYYKYNNQIAVRIFIMNYIIIMNLL